MNADDDDAGFEAALAAKFGSGYGASRAGANARQRRELRQGETPAQRARRGPPTKQMNFRATDRTRGLIDTLAGKLDVPNTQVIAMAIELLAKKEGVSQ